MFQYYVSRFATDISGITSNCTNGVAHSFVYLFKAMHTGLVFHSIYILLHMCHYCFCYL